MFARTKVYDVEAGIKDLADFPGVLAEKRVLVRRQRRKTGWAQYTQCDLGADVQGRDGQRRHGALVD